MVYFSRSKITSHHFHIDNDEVKLGICYDMIIGCDLRVQLCRLVYFKRQVLQWDGVTVPMEEPRCLLGQTCLTIREMREVVMQTSEPVSAR